MKKAYFNWSSGKDSALALYKVLQEKEFHVEKLITNINKDYNRVSMHGLRKELLEIQAESIGIPLHKIEFSSDVTMSSYNKIMKEQTQILKSLNFDHAIFGDIFLEDLRAYRDKKLLEVGISGVYPLWNKNKRLLLYEFLNLGFKAIVVCANAKLLSKEFVGRIIDENFIADLPESVDVCGENGEFHTFCFDGPIFKKTINFEVGEKVLRSYTLQEKDDDNCYSFQEKETKNFDSSFWYIDLKLLKST